MARFVTRLVALGVLLCGVALVWTVVFIARHADPDPVPEASAIVVLSGPWQIDPEPFGETVERVARGVALFEAGRAERLVMSGGGRLALDGGPGDARFMADIAVSQGVPSDAILLDPTSHSTLQNAWNTARLAGIEPADPILLVTHRYHLSRAVASFRWAGFSDVTGIAADPGAAQPVTPWLLLEGVKWPLNVARAAGVSVALALGAAEADVLPWLR